MPGLDFTHSTALAILSTCDKIPKEAPNNKGKKAYKLWLLTLKINDYKQTMTANARSAFFQGVLCPVSHTSSVTLTEQNLTFFYLYVSVALLLTYSFIILLNSVTFCSRAGLWQKKKTFHNTYPDNYTDHNIILLLYIQ